MTDQRRAAHRAGTSPVPGSRPGEGVEVLSRAECLRQLAGIGMGRVAVSIGALPTVCPVPFMLRGEDVVFPAVAGSELAWAVGRVVVAFEADHIGPNGGWSVVVTGIASEVSDERELQHLRAISPCGDVGHEPPLFFRIGTDIISGRWLPRAPLHVAGITLATGPGTTAWADGTTGSAPSVLDPAAYESIPPGECLRLLASEELGRLVVVVGGEPLMFPLNYALDGDAVVFRTAPGTKLQAISRSHVAFEVDRWDPSCQSGWSVVVEGLAQEITGADAPGLRERLARLPVRPLATGDRLHFVRIVPTSMRGSRLHR